jgi:hypothetical protein
VDSVDNLDIDRFPGLEYLDIDKIAPADEEG